MSVSKYICDRCGCDIKRYDSCTKITISTLYFCFYGGYNTIYLCEKCMKKLKKFLKKINKEI